jgi:hypothetical protein
LEHNSYNTAEKSNAKSETYDLSILMVLATVVWNSIHKLILVLNIFVPPHARTREIDWRV